MEPWCCIFFLLSAASSIAVYWFLKRRFIRRNLLHQNQHPIVGQQGKWQLTIDATNLTLQTAAGQQQWPLAEVTYHEFERRPIALFLEDDLAFALPPLGDYVDDKYHSFVTAMKLRISTKQMQQS